MAISAVPGSKAAPRRPSRPPATELLPKAPWPVPASSKDEGLPCPLHEPMMSARPVGTGMGPRVPAQEVEQDPRRGQRLREGHRAVGGLEGLPEPFHAGISGVLPWACSQASTSARRNRGLFSVPRDRAREVLVTPAPVAHRTRPHPGDPRDVSRRHLYQLPTSLASLASSGSSSTVYSSPLYGPLGHGLHRAGCRCQPYLVGIVDTPCVVSHGGRNRLSPAPRRRAIAGRGFCPPRS